MSDDVQAFLANLPPTVEPIARALRKRIRTLLPDAVEQRHGGWKIIGYSVDGSMKSSICAIAPHSGHVNLQFFRGAELDDPDGLLEGSGKKARHIKLREASEAETPEVARLLEASARLAAGR